MERFVSTIIELPFDRAAAQSAARIRAELERQGTPIGPYDLLIAGQALAAGLTRVTNNVSEFRRVPGLKVESWPCSGVGLEHRGGSIPRRTPRARHRWPLHFQPINRGCYAARRTGPFGCTAPALRPPPAPPPVAKPARCGFRAGIGRTRNSSKQMGVAGTPGTP